MTDLKNIFVPITKVDEERRLVYGLFSAERPDASGEIMDYDTGKSQFQEWSDAAVKRTGGRSKGNVRAMHGNVAAGYVTDIAFNDEAKTVTGCVKVVDDNEWNKVLEGVYAGFSIGGRYAKRWRDEKNPELYRFTPVLSELSIVDNPCLPDATFELIRANGAVEMRKFKTQEQSMSLNKEYKALGVEEPTQGWIAKDGSTHATKEDAFKKNAELQAGSAAAPALAKLDELTKTLDAAEADRQEALAKKDYSDDERKEMAANGEAMEDGSYPIKNKSDLKDAIQAFGRAKDKDKAKAHIKARAKALGAEGMLPDSWTNSEKAAAAEKLKKFIGNEAWDAACAIEALQAIACLLMREEFDEHTESDEQIDDLKQAIERLKSFIASEIMEEPGEAEKAAKADTTGDLQKAGARHSKVDMGHLKKAVGHAEELEDHLGDADKAHGHVGAAHEGMRKCMDGMNECMKAMGAAPVAADKSAEADELAKASKAMKEHLAKAAAHLGAMDEHMDKAEKHHGKMGKSHEGMHKSLDGLHEAHKALGVAAEKTDADKAADDELAKVATAMQADNDLLKSENESLKKSINNVTEQLGTVLDRVKRLEAQPLPAHGALYETAHTGVAPVLKGHEAIPAKPVEAPVINRGLSPEAQRRQLGIQ